DFNQGTWTDPRGPNAPLVGQGGGTREAHLWTTRRGYKDFALRVSLPAQPGLKMPWVYVRGAKVDGKYTGYVVGLAAAPSVGSGFRAGSVRKVVPGAAPAGPDPPAAVADPGGLFTLEVRAVGNVLTTFVNGVEAARFEDPANPIPSGAVGFVAAGPDTVRLRRVEFQELPRP